MPVQLTSEQVWRVISQQIFAVLAVVTPKQEPRTVGVVYVVQDRALYICTEQFSWKVRHISASPNVSLTVTIPKRIPFLPWIKIPPATIAFQGEATIQKAEQVSPELRKALLRGLETPPDVLSRLCFIRVRPQGRFLAYGVGVSLWTMRKPEKSRGLAPV